MEHVPPEEQYETDTIFSQGDDYCSEHYLDAKLKEIESDSEVFPDEDNKKKTKINLLSDDEEDDETHTFHTDILNSFPLSTTADPVKQCENSFEAVKNLKKFNWDNKAPANGDFFYEDDTYDLSQDSFRYGRVTNGVSYNLMTGRMPKNVMEKVKSQDEENDRLLLVKEDKDTHLYTSELTVSLGQKSDLNCSFQEMYDNQMPRYFDYRAPFPVVNGIWTILFDQAEYNNMSTFELQAAICAALNSKKYMLICIGVDAYNDVTGVELSAAQRVTFRMALSRAVAGEFQPPLVKIPPKLLTGVSPMKRDVSEFTSLIDIQFLPVLHSESRNEMPKRYLIVVRVKELTEKLYQLSSGRIYAEEEGQVVELSCLEEAYRVLVLEKNEETNGSMFMLHPESVQQLPEIEQESDDDEVVEDSSEDEKEDVEQDFQNDGSYKELAIGLTTCKTLQKFSSNFNKHRKEFIGWTLLGIAFSYGIFKMSKKHV